MGLPNRRVIVILFVEIVFLTGSHDLALKFDLLRLLAFTVLLELDLNHLRDGPAEIIIAGCLLLISW
jgi:hypothetical protein